MARRQTEKVIDDHYVLATYQTLMDEIVRRQKIISKVLGGKWPEVDQRTGEEICYFHFRMVCELIAIGCLVAHGDIVETRHGKLRHMYQADAIIKMLERLHRDFYPIPQEQVPTKTGQMQDLKDVTTSYLTKEELVRLYRKCGDILHIGSADRWAHNWTRAPDLEEANNWQGKIVVLLNQHRIRLIRKDYELWATMVTDRGASSASIFKYIGLKETVEFPLRD
jgi:hypothetical protein